MPETDDTGATLEADDPELLSVMQWMSAIRGVHNRQHWFFYDLVAVVSRPRIDNGHAWVTDLTYPKQ